MCGCGGSHSDRRRSGSSRPEAEVGKRPPIWQSISGSIAPPAAKNSSACRPWRRHNGQRRGGNEQSSKTSRRACSGRTRICGAARLFRSTSRQSLSARAGGWRHSVMDRRTFIGTLTVSLLVAPLAVEAQQAQRVPRIGVLTMSVAMWRARTSSSKYASRREDPRGSLAWQPNWSR